MKKILKERLTLLFVFDIVERNLLDMDFYMNDDKFVQ